MSKWIVFGAYSLVLLLVILVGYVRQVKQYKFLDFTHTGILKGIAIILIIWGHIGKRIGIGGIQWIAGIGVSLFLMCSGYGLELSAMKNVLKGFWKKRIINTILPFYLVSFIGLWIVGSASVSDAVDILTFRTQWFMNYIIICYLIYFLITFFFRENVKRINFLAVSFAIWFVIDSVYFASPEAPFLRARQMFTFLSGVIIANKKKEAEQLFSKPLFMITQGIIGVLFLGLTNLQIVKILPIFITNMLSLLTTAPLAFFAISLTVQCKKIFSNTVLMFAGSISYELFLVHNYSSVMIESKLLTLIIFSFVTVFLSWLFNVLYTKIIKNCIKKKGA